MKYEQKYKELVDYVKKMYEISKNFNTKEPCWPYKIEDSKQVLRFRNDVFDHAFEIGIRAGIGGIQRFIERKQKEES